MIKIILPGLQIFRYMPDIQSLLRMFFFLKFSWTAMVFFETSYHHHRLQNTTVRYSRIFYKVFVEKQRQVFRKKLKHFTSTSLKTLIQRPGVTCSPQHLSVSIVAYRISRLIYMRIITIMRI